MLKNTFCSSPWFHIKLGSDGSYERCRWVKNPAPQDNFSKTSLMEYYHSDSMSKFRQQLLSGTSPDACESCYYQEQFGKLSGRQRQLLKSAITVDNFELSLRSSPHWDYFDHSNNNQGQANYAPVDLQIDLGNLCNSSCIMCWPNASSRVSADYVKLNQIAPDLFESPAPYSTWTNDPDSVDRFVNQILEIPSLKYIHFLGGETLYNEAFYTICERLIDAGRANSIIVGTTTNGTIFNDRIQQLIPHFKQFHLGISVETVTPLNDYIRYPSKIDSVKTVINSFIKLRDSNPGLFISMRITPNVFTISEFDLMARFLLENRVIAESCDILHKPECLVMEIMPDDIRTETLSRIESVIEEYQLEATHVVNVRDPNLIDSVTADTIIAYRDFVKNYTVPENVEQLRSDLVRFLESYESLRHNSILDYAPRYQDFLRRYGY